MNTLLNRMVAAAVMLVAAGNTLALQFNLSMVRTDVCPVEPADTIAEGEWMEGTPMPTPRSEIASAVLEGRIYVAGGIVEQFEGATAFEVYDPQTDAWEEAAPLPVGLHHAGMAADDQRVYIGGGYTSLDFNVDVSALWAYDPETNRWEQIAEMPYPRAAHTMAVIDGKLYVVGGVGQDSTVLWVYDLETNAWDTSRASLPTAREHLASAVVDGKLYVIGGRWSGQGNLSTLEVYDPQADSWERLAEIPTPRGGLTAAAVNGLIHVTGGEAFNPDCTFNRHEVYDPQTDRWRALPDLPTPRHGLTSASVDGKWYVIGGATGAGSQTLETLSDAVHIFTPAAVPAKGKLHQIYSFLAARSAFAHRR
jgi:N-acetylneuraminic acid mutarotase